MFDRFTVIYANQRRVAQPFRRFCSFQFARVDDTTEGRHRGVRWATSGLREVVQTKNILAT